MQLLLFFSLGSAGGGQIRRRRVRACGPSGAPQRTRSSPCNERGHHRGPERVSQKGSRRGFFFWNCSESVGHALSSAAAGLRSRRRRQLQAPKGPASSDVVDFGACRHFPECAAERARPPSQRRCSDHRTTADHGNPAQEAKSAGPPLGQLSPAVLKDEPHLQELQSKQ